MLAALVTPGDLQLAGERGQPSGCHAEARPPLLERNQARTDGALAEGCVWIEPLEPKWLRIFTFVYVSFALVYITSA